MSRVLHVLGRMERGGAELGTLELMRALESRHRCDVCALSGRPGALDGEVRRLGGEVHLIDLGPTFVSRFVGLLRRERYDIVHSHVFYSSGFILGLARAAGVPRRIAHFHSSTDGHPPTIVRRLRDALLRGLIDACATDIVSCSEAAEDAVWGARRHGDPRCRVLYLGIPLPQRSSREPSRGAGPVLLHIGTLRRPKNHRKLLTVFAALLRRVPSAVLQLAGADGGEEVALKRQAYELGIAERVYFLGARGDVDALIQQADLMIFPSLWEGLGCAVLEATAEGLPVLASDIPAMHEITRYLPRVRILPVAASDEMWADVAVEMLQTATLDERKAAREAFAETPFTLPRAVARFDELWSRSSPK